jgi:riboflavin kinase, archaea type
MALDWVQQALKKSLGFSPYPATLNLKLESEDDVGAWQKIRREVRTIDIPPTDGGFCNAQLFCVEIIRPGSDGERRLQGAVLLPDVQGYPADKIEVIAPMRLKNELQVQDGDQLTLEFAH